MSRFSAMKLKNAVLGDTHRRMLRDYFKLEKQEDWKHLRQHCENEMQLMLLYSKNLEACKGFFSYYKELARICCLKLKQQELKKAF